MAVDPKKIVFSIKDHWISVALTLVISFSAGAALINKVVHSFVPPPIKLNTTFYYFNSGSMLKEPIGERTRQFLAGDQLRIRTEGENAKHYYFIYLNGTGEPKFVDNAIRKDDGTWELTFPEDTAAPTGAWFVVATQSELSHAMQDKVLDRLRNPPLGKLNFCKDYTSVGAKGVTLFFDNGDWNSVLAKDGMSANNVKVTESWPDRVIAAMKSDEITRTLGHFAYQGVAVEIKPPKDKK